MKYRFYTDVCVFKYFSPTECWSNLLFNRVSKCFLWMDNIFEWSTLCKLVANNWIILDCGMG